MKKDARLCVFFANMFCCPTLGAATQFQLQLQLLQGAKSILLHDCDI